VDELKDVSVRSFIDKHKQVKIPSEKIESLFIENPLLGQVLTAYGNIYLLLI
jgi:hypothetical protein